MKKKGFAASWVFPPTTGEALRQRERIVLFAGLVARPRVEWVDLARKRNRLAMAQ